MVIWNNGSGVSSWSCSFFKISSNEGMVFSFLVFSVINSVLGACTIDETKGKICAILQICFVSYLILTDLYDCKPVNSFFNSIFSFILFFIYSKALLAPIIASISNLPSELVVLLLRMCLAHPHEHLEIRDCDIGATL